MRKRMKIDGCGEWICFAVGSVLMAAGFIIIPPLIQRWGNKIYKKILSTNEMDFNDIGPEIVPFDEETKEKGEWQE